MRESRINRLADLSAALVVKGRRFLDGQPSGFRPLGASAGGKPFFYQLPSQQAVDTDLRQTPLNVTARTQLPEQPTPITAIPVPEATPIVDLRESAEGDATRQLDSSRDAVTRRQSDTIVHDLVANLAVPVEDLKEESINTDALENGVRGVMQRFILPLQAIERRIRTHSFDEKLNETPEITTQTKGFRRRKVLKASWENFKDRARLISALQPGPSQNDFLYEVTARTIVYGKDMGVLHMQHHEGQATTARLQWRHIQFAREAPTSEELRELLATYPALTKLITRAETLAPSEAVSHQEIEVTIHEPSTPSSGHSKDSPFSITVTVSQVDKKTPDEIALEQRQRKLSSRRWGLLCALDSSGGSTKKLHADLREVNRQIGEIRGARYHSHLYTFNPTANYFSGASSHTSHSAEIVTAEAMTDEIVAGLFSLIPIDIADPAIAFGDPIQVIALPGQRINQGQNE